ncbi:uncharacterized protein BDW47DRAFT_100305 [Aspergillus candidus]|uniref:Uncharacterized protein n=1 Tax=Aspergillus candidus TaxID=41067 RepID=A0A2I2FK38_ASPCN|nr:hypothetical protein BDW47DRAFT_100305 [Aspergillus candidus]PLB40989.1 hypothetical protein BDW47DRAFT_100305 [Aspergillus candidus]
MPPDQLLFQTGLGGHSPENELLDFDHFFQFPSDESGSDPTSVTSISPKDLDLTYTETDMSNWESQAAWCPDASLADWMNVDASLDMGNSWDTGAVLNPADMFQLPTISSTDESSAWVQDVPSLGDPFYSVLRDMVESQAAVDPRASSDKEKRREAAIAIHMQRLQDSSLVDLNPSSDSTTSFSSGCSVAPSSATAATTPPSESSHQSPTPVPCGGMEIVLDLNMDTATNLPKKQKPRSRAQKENYINVRKHGACEKHRKQHKRCNCLDKAAARVAVTDAAAVPKSVFAERGRTTMRRRVDEMASPNVQLPTTVDRVRRHKIVSLDPSCGVPEMVAAPHGSRSSLSLQQRPEVVNTGHFTRHMVSTHDRVLPLEGVGRQTVDQNPSVLRHGRKISDKSGGSGHRPLQCTQDSSVLGHRAASGENPSSPAVTRCPNAVAFQSDQSMVERYRLRPKTQAVRSPALSASTNVVQREAGLTIQSLLRSASSVIQCTIRGLASVWHCPSALVSLAVYGRIVIFSSRQHWLTRKGLGLL